MVDSPLDRRKLFHSLLYPGLFVGLLWLIKITEVLTESSFSGFGVNPRNVADSWHILTMPLLHGSWEHLFSNSVPLFVLGSFVVYFYRPLHFKVFWWIFIFSGVFTWIMGRPSTHIGASGVVYGLVSFLFVSGILRRRMDLMAISAITILLYGSIVWGLMPLVETISWEGHLSGFMVGLFVALGYRNQGPQKPVKVWEEEPEDPNVHPYWMPFVPPDPDTLEVDFEEISSINTTIEKEETTTSIKDAVTYRYEYIEKKNEG